MQNDTVLPKKYLVLRTYTTKISTINIILTLQVRELNLPLKHNQLVVVRFISQIRDDDRFWCKDLLAEGMTKRRWEILTTKVY